MNPARAPTLPLSRHGTCQLIRHPRPHSTASPFVSGNSSTTPGLTLKFWRSHHHLFKPSCMTIWEKRRDELSECRLTSSATKHMTAWTAVKIKWSLVVLDRQRSSMISLTSEGAHLSFWRRWWGLIKGMEYNSVLPLRSMNQLVLGAVWDNWGENEVMKNSNSFKCTHQSLFHQNKSIMNVIYIHV